MKDQNPSFNSEGSLLFRNIIYIQKSSNLKHLILDEILNIPYSNHLGYQKVIKTLKKYYYYSDMIIEVSEYIFRCLEC